MTSKSLILPRYWLYHINYCSYQNLGWIPEIIDLYKMLLPYSSSLIVSRSCIHCCHLALMWMSYDISQCSDLWLLILTTTHYSCDSFVTHESLNIIQSLFWKIAYIVVTWHWSGCPMTCSNVHTHDSNSWCWQWLMTHATISRLVRHFL